MSKIEKVLVIMSIYCFLLFPKVASGFVFLSSSATAYMNASTFPKTLGSITSLASGAASVKADGWPNSVSHDLVKIQSITLNSALVNRGFTIEIKIANGSWMSRAAALNKCVWVDGNCSTNGSTSTAVKNMATQAISVRLKRNSMAPYDAIPNGTNIATITLQQYGSSQLGSVALLYFRFNGAVIPVVPTCDVKNFDERVTLPGIKRADLVNHGTGRYTGVTTDFSINLDCVSTPKVSMKFDGTKMSGVTGEDVLANTSSGNNNVGIQLVYKNNAMKIGENIQVINAAGASEELKFNAYYYYKGGTIQSGPIKANSEFTFTYE